MVGGSASLLRQGGGQGMQSSTQGIPVQHLDDTFQQLARVFEKASGETQVSIKGRSPSPNHRLLLALCARLHAVLPPGRWTSLCALTALPRSRKKLRRRWWKPRQSVRRTRLPWMSLHSRTTGQCRKRYAAHSDASLLPSLCLRHGDKQAGRHSRHWLAGV